MIYEPLATRLRPRTFAEVVGQDATVKILQNAVRLSRLATSYVFSGPPGTGKTTCARLFAAALNCKGPGAASRGCGGCESCLDVQLGRHPDVIEIDAASDRGVSMVDTLQDLVSLVLPDGAHRVFVIDECHSVSAKAWGAFLKTIEEPPPRNHFVFVTTDREKVLPTVRSRSSSFVFRPVPDIVIHHALVSAVHDPLFNPVILQVIARAARGSMRDALHLLDKVTLLGQTTVEEVEQLVGVDSESIRDLADALIGPFNPAYWLQTLDKVESRGLLVTEVLDAILWIARDVLVASVGYRGEAMTRISLDRIAENAKALPSMYLLALYDAVVAVYESNLRDRIGLETLYFKAHSWAQ